MTLSGTSGSWRDSLPKCLFTTRNFTTFQLALFLNISVSKEQSTWLGSHSICRWNSETMMKKANLNNLSTISSTIDHLATQPRVLTEEELQR